MSSKLLFAVVGLALVATLSAPYAAARLNPTMRAWKADAAKIDAMLAGGPVNQGETARILQGIAADAQDIASRVSASSPEGKDVKARFAKLTDDVQAALDSVATTDQLRSRFAAVRADCRSCHRVYAN